MQALPAFRISRAMELSELAGLFLGRTMRRATEFPPLPPLSY